MKSMPQPMIAGDEGGGKVELTPYGWGTGSGDGTSAVWMAGAYWS